MVRDGVMWFSEAAGDHIGRLTVDGNITEFPIPTRAASRARCALTRRLDLVRADLGNGLCRIARDGGMAEYKVTTPNASLRSVCVGPDGDLWFTENFANKIGRMAPDGTMLGEYDIPTPNSGARCIAAMSDGRLSSRNGAPG